MKKMPKAPAPRPQDAMARFDRLLTAMVTKVAADAPRKPAHRAKPKSKNAKREKN